MYQWRVRLQPVLQRLRNVVHLYAHPAHHMLLMIISRYRVQWHHHGQRELFPDRVRHDRQRHLLKWFYWIANSRLQQQSLGCRVQSLHSYAHHAMLRLLTCNIASSCPADNTSHVGSATYPLTNGGEWANGTCLSGYAGSATRRCQSDGVWATSALTSCTRLLCEATTMGNAYFPDTDSLTSGYGTCFTGYSGSPSSSCSASGTWGEVTSPCVRTRRCCCF